MSRLPILLLLQCLLVSAPVNDPAAAARAKLLMIQSGRAPRGGIVVFTELEVNAYARSELPLTVPHGVRQPRVELGRGTANGYLLIDLAKLQNGTETPWLIAKLIEGERPMKVSARIESSRGKATVFLQRVEISGVGVSGSTLDFLVENFFRPLFPDAKINQPFDLNPRVDHLEVGAGAVAVFLRK